MILVQETSSGRIVLAFDYTSRTSGLRVAVYRLGADGWSDESSTWRSDSPADSNEAQTGYGEDGKETTLTHVIASVGDISTGEASGLAAASLEEWKRRDGRPRLGRADTAKGFALVTGIGGGVLLLAGLVAVAVVLLVRAL